MHASGLSVEDEVVRRVVTAAAETDRVGAVEAAVVAAVRRPDTTTVDSLERLLRMDRMMDHRLDDEDERSDAKRSERQRRQTVAGSERQRRQTATVGSGRRRAERSVAAVVDAAVAMVARDCGGDEQALTLKRMMMRTVTAWAMWRPTIDNAAAAASVDALAEKAAHCGEAAVVERLVDRCVRVGDRTHKLMCEMARGGHVAMLEVLLGGGIRLQQGELRDVMRGPGCGGDEVRALMRRRDMQDAVRGDRRFVARCCHNGREERMAERLSALLDGEYAGCVDVNEMYFRSTALHLCSLFHWLECVRVLVRTPGVDMNAGDAERCTTLHLAARQGFVKVVRELIEVGGADVNAGDKTGHTPLDYAVFNNKDAAAAVLRAHGGQPRQR